MKHLELYHSQCCPFITSFFKKTLFILSHSKFCIQKQALLELERWLCDKSTWCSCIGPGFKSQHPYLQARKLPSKIGIERGIPLWTWTWLIIGISYFFSSLIKIPEKKHHKRGGFALSPDLVHHDRTGMAVEISQAMWVGAGNHCLFSAHTAKRPEPSKGQALMTYVCPLFPMSPKF